MSIEVWTWIGIVTVIVWGVIIYDIANSPVYPVDYNNDDEEAELREVPTQISDVQWYRYRR